MGRISSVVLLSYEISQVSIRTAAEAGLKLDQVMPGQ
jgi:hypothetical protein